MRRMAYVTIPAVAMALLVAGCMSFKVGEPERYRLDCGKDGSILVTMQRKMGVGVFPAALEEVDRPHNSAKPMVGWYHMGNGKFSRQELEPVVRNWFFGFFSMPYALLVAPWHGDYSCDTHYWAQGNVEKLAMFPADVRLKLGVKLWQDGGHDFSLASQFTHSAWLGVHRFTTIVVEELDKGEEELRPATANGESLENEYAKLAEGTKRRFFVESAEGIIRRTNRVVVGQRLMSYVDKAAISAVLSRRAPKIFKKGDGAIPLHIMADGQVAPTRATVTIWIDNNGDKRVSHVTLEDLADLHDRDKDDFGELIALGVVKALNAMTPEQIAKLVAREHHTIEQRRALSWLTSSSATTFSVNADGALFVESEHKFTPVQVDFAELARFPEIIGQAFDAGSRTGKVVADITGCDEIIASEYLFGRLVPEICRTKTVVFDPVTVPPAGAQFRIDSSERKAIDGKDIVQIFFTALQ